MTPPENDRFLGEVVGGRYQVVARIGRGAMGAIYEVRHTKLKRSFALKRLMPHLADDKEALERFQQEADVVAGLRHPNVVEIVDWETLSDGTPCIVMELLRGENLEQRVARVGKLEWSELFSIADQALSALAVAHRAGIVHRDLKPQNLYLARDDSGDERVKLLDFGISKVQGSGHTSAGAVIGTPAYMAPEQADSRNEDISAGTDLWAMGAILYELATGVQAFTGVSASSVLYKVCYGNVDPVSTQRPDAPPGFGALIERLLLRSVKERLSDADELRRALKAVSTGAPVPFIVRSTPPASVTVHTTVDAPPLAPHSSTTLSGTTGQSIALPVEPEPASARAPRWIPLAAVGALALIVAGIALRPAAPPPKRVQPATPAPLPMATPVEKPLSTPLGVPSPIEPVRESTRPSPASHPVPKLVEAPPPVRPASHKLVKKPAAHPTGTPSQSSKPEMRPIDPFAP